MPADLVPSNAGGDYLANSADTSVTTWSQPQTPAHGRASGLGAQLHRSIAALKRFWWVVALFLAVGVAVGWVLAQFVAPKYNVIASVWVREKKGTAGPIEIPGLVSGHLSWSDLVQSQAVLDSAVVRLALFARPREIRDTTVLRSMHPTDTLTPGSYRLELQNGVRYSLTRVEDARGSEVNKVVEQGSVGDSVGRSIGLSWLPDWTQTARDRPTLFDLVPPREAAAGVARQLTVGVAETSNLMRLVYSGTEPVLLASTLNTVLDVFIETARRLKREELTQTFKALEEQRQQAANDMSAAAKALEIYRVRTITLPSDNVPVAPGVQFAQNPAFTAYFGDRTSLSGIRQDRELLESVLGDRGTAAWIERLRTIPNLGTNNPNLSTAISELDAKRNQLRLERQTKTELHRDIVELRARIQELEAQAIPQLAQTSLTQLRSRERDLDRRVREAGQELQQIPTRTIEEDRLTRNHQVAVSVYNELHGRTINARLAEASAQPDVSILDRAIPPGRPSTDTKLAIFLVAVGASLAAGILLVLLVDRLDKRFRYPEQAVGELGLDILGVVPSLKHPRNSAARLEEYSQMMEAFRSLGLSIRSAFPPNEPLAFTVSSPGPGDGKSFIAANLALVLADAGFRTVLIDGDIRRGRLNEVKPLIGCSQSPGLLEHLAGEATLAEAVRETTHPNLSAIPSGARRRQGPELLSSEAMPRLINELRGQFDAVIIDSAPLAAGIDPYALGAACGAMVIVLRAGETDTKLAQTKLNTIDRLPVRLIGAVLNDVGSDAAYREYAYLGYEYAGMAEGDSMGLIATGADSGTGRGDKN